MGLLGPHSDPPLHHGEEDAHRDKGASRTGSRSKTALPIHRSAWKEYSPKFGRFLCAVRHAPYAPRAVSASLHACSQRLQASAHTRQCSMSISMACCSHSSAHKPHASAQARIAALAIAGSNAVCLETTLPVVAHTSEQLRHIVMQRFKCPTISSPRQASAQALHDWEQSKHASMHSISASASMAAVPGWVSSISLACVIWASPFLELVCSVTKAGKRSAHSPKCLEGGFCELRTMRILGSSIVRVALATTEGSQHPLLRGWTGAIAVWTGTLLQPRRSRKSAEAVTSGSRPVSPCSEPPTKEET